MNFIKYLIVALLLVGCYTDRKATKQGEHLFQAKPAIAAKLSTKYFPQEEITRDTVLSYIDTTITVICDTIYGEAKDYITITDTVVKKVVKYKDVLVKVPSKTIIVKEKDSAEAVVLRSQIETLTIAKAKTEGKLSTTTKLFISFLILFILSLLGNVLQLKKK